MTKKDLGALKTKTLEAFGYLEKVADTIEQMRKAIEQDVWEMLDLDRQLREICEE